MDPELRQAFAGLYAQMADVAKDVRAAAQVGVETKKSHEALAYRFGMLESYVHGSTPPPPPDAGNGRTPTLDDEIEAKVKGVVSAELLELRALRRETRDQSKARGIGVVGFKWLMTREGRTVSAAFATLLCAIAAVIGACRVAAGPLPVPALPAVSVSR